VILRAGLQQPGARLMGINSIKNSGCTTLQLIP